MSKIKKNYERFFVYYLLDPRDSGIPLAGEYAYVGQCVDRAKRLELHYYSIDSNDSDKSLWLANLRLNNVKPLMSTRCILQTEEEALRIENSLIDVLFFRGVKVTNKMPWHNYEHSFSQETCEKLRLAGLGNQHLYGHTHTEESRERMSQSQIARHARESGLSIKDYLQAKEQERINNGITQFGTLEYREKMRLQALKNNAIPPSWQGKKHTDITKHKQSVANWLVNHPTPEYLTKRIIQEQIKLDKLSISLIKTPDSKILPERIDKTIIKIGKLKEQLENLVKSSGLLASI